jgi:hypothetical protein
MGPRWPDGTTRKERFCAEVQAKRIVVKKEREVSVLLCVGPRAVLLLVSLRVLLFVGSKDKDE